MRRYAIELTGKTPLLMHHDNIEWADTMDEWKNDPANKTKSKAGDDRTPAFRWFGCLYHDGETVAIPQENIMRCLMEGGAMVLVPGGRSGKTFKSQTQSGMICESPFWPLSDAILLSDLQSLVNEENFATHKKVVRSLGFDLFVKRAKVGTSKHIRVRPKFDQWSVHGSLTVTDDQITTEVLRSILDYAGRYKGIGDWRPGGKTPGSFGMFEAKVEEC